MRYKLSDNTKIKCKNPALTISPQHLAKKLKSKGWSVVFANKPSKPSKPKIANKTNEIRQFLKTITNPSTIKATEIKS